MNTLESIKKDKDYIISLRREFHKYPELSWQEFETSKKIKKELEKLNIPFLEVAITGVIGIIKGKKEKPVIGLRCDIDALPIEEIKNLDFKSQNKGVMHACGHDGHISMLLGAAKFLSENRDKLDCTVKLIFQPAEENFQGAKKVLESGYLDDVDTFVGMHIFPYLPTGTISVEEGPRYTSADFIKIKVIGKSGHGAMPQFAIDPIYIGSQVVNGLQSIVSRECNPNETCVISICTFHSGTLPNIFEESAELSGTVRTFSPELRKELPEKIERVIDNITRSFRGTYEFEYIHGPAATINDKKYSKIAIETVKTILGEKGLTTYTKTPGGEDFALMLEKKPGIYAFVGCRNEENDQCYSLHHQCFDLDEESLIYGAAFYSQYVLDVQYKID
ncbi:M20 metallopeptidase family protein [Fusobacterium perfoetens]|uniref:M20 metallopeptidase family protein n=1 Tax=Fusobacterium perfoetens TaxID=852 RepID=UPI0004812FDD|nr:amidohydrolase [Fusobacterium perfoetens]MCI6151682.1 amidohydrolase [Fusobacterium perfoetens]MDY3236562.1 amidohydrolase [Fusobacterium perfoetens]